MSQADLPDLIKSGKIKEASDILKPLTEIDCSQNLLWYAAEYNRKSLILMILSKCNVVNGKTQVMVKSSYKEETPLETAYRKKHVDVMTELLFHANQPKIKIGVPTKIFNFAISNKNEMLIKLILDSGASAKGRLYNVNTDDNVGEWTALLYAAANNKLDIVEKLMNHPRIDVNTVDNVGWTALMYAARDDQPDVVISLMNHPKIDVNLQDKSGNTALHYAVFNNHPDIVKLLLSGDKKIDAKLKNTRGQTPLSLAKSLKHTDIEKLLPKPSLFGNLFSKKRPGGESKNTSKFAVLKY